MAHGQATKIRSTDGTDQERNTEKKKKRRLQTKIHIVDNIEKLKRESAVKP